MIRKSENKKFLYKRLGLNHKDRTDNSGLLISKLNYKSKGVKDTTQVLEIVSISRSEMVIPLHILKLQTIRERNGDFVL